MAPPSPPAKKPHIEIQNLTMAYGTNVVQRDLTFTINEGDIFVIMGGSGCGKSTLLRHLIGLLPPSKGRVLYHGEDFWNASMERRNALMQNAGVLYQSGALWTSMTLAENVSLPMEEHTSYSKTMIRELASLKLSLVGLGGFDEYYPSEISGGMKKRAGFARAMALDPDILFFDEPSAGLDPISSQNLDQLIRDIRESLGATIVVVTHELPSIFAIGTNSVFLDAESKTMIAAGPPRELLDHCDNQTVQRFLRRGGTLNPAGLQA